jgi:hypothetical protein
MAEEDQDFHIESADAGASDVIPCEAGAIKKGGYVSTNDISLETRTSAPIHCASLLYIS